MSQPPDDSVFAVKILEPGEARPGSVLIGFRRQGMLVRRGSEEIVVPYRELMIGLVENSEEKLQIHYSGNILVFPVSDRELVRAILASPSGPLQETLREILEGLRPTHHVLAHGMFLSLLCLAAVFGVLQLFTYAGRWALLRSPPSWEVELGKKGYEVFGKSSENNNEILKAAVQKVAAPLLKALPKSDYEFEIHVSTSSQVNAMAYPGGQIVVYTGLIADTRSPEELAGVLAHEMSHVILRHSLKALGNKLGMSAMIAAIPWGFGDVHARILRFVPDLLSLRFSREEEQEADLGGALLLRTAGISADGMVSFFERLSKEEGSTGAIFGFLRSHPTSGDRVEYLNQIAKEVPKSTFHFDIDWEAVRKEADVHPGEDPFQLGRGAR